MRDREKRIQSHCANALLLQREKVLQGAIFNQWRSLVVSRRLLATGMYVYPVCFPTLQLAPKPHILYTHNLIYICICICIFIVLLTSLPSFSSGDMRYEIHVINMLISI